MRLAVKTFRWVTICLVACLVGTQGLSADEPAARFLNALRDKGYYDIALEYLEKAKVDPNVNEQFRKRIKYEKAIVLIDQVGQLSEREKIDLQLDTAQKLLQDYAANNSSLVETSRTLSFRSRLLSMRADVYLNEAKADQLTEGERQKLRGKARGYLEESLEAVTNALVSLKPLLDSSPSNKDALKISADDPQSRELVKEMRNIYRVMTVQRPFNAEQLASTFPERSPERKQLLTDAADLYKRICEGSYANTIPGVRASLRAGLCYQQLGLQKEALKFFMQVISRERAPAIDSLQKKAFAAAGDSWQKIKPYPARLVISQLEPVVESLSRSESRDPAWLRVKLELGIAKYELSKAVKETDGVTKAKKVAREAGRLVRDVTRVNSPSRERARALLEEWNVPLIEPADLEKETQTVNSFATAFEAGSDAIANIEVLYGEWIRARAAAEAAPEKNQVELKAAAQELAGSLRKAADNAISTFNQALALSNSSTSSDEINWCRFYQCFCYFVTERHLEVSVIGQYLLNQHPDDAGTKPAVGLLLKSRAAAYAGSPKDDNFKELQDLKTTALEIARRWPGSPESGNAISELIQIALREDDTPQAVELMERLPGDSPRRLTLTTVLGQRLWAKYQVDVRNPQLAVNTNEMQKKLAEAVRFLQVSESLADPKAVRFSDAVTGLNLIDAMLEIGDPEKALSLLESSPLSPTQVIKSANPAVFENARASRYKRDAYSVIIKTYLARLATAKDQQAWLDKANGVIELMRQEVEASGNADSKRQLTAIYHLISVQLTKGFKESSDPKEQIQLARALADFMGGIEENSTNGRVLLNLGSSLLSMANSLSQDGMKDKAKGFFLKASKALSKAETLGFAGDRQEAALKFELQRQKALAQRGAGQYEQAIANFTAMLKAKSKSLPMQIDAAMTLQQWGKEQQLSTQLAQAVKGTGQFKDPATKRPTNAIWGWAKIMRLTQSQKKKFRDQYFTAAYGIAEAIYEQGKAKGTDAKPKALARIKGERAKTPDFLESKAWENKFNALEKRIENGE